MSVIADDADASPSIAFNVRGTLKFAHWNGASWDIDSVDVDPSGGWFRDCSLAYDAGGTPFISYWDDYAGVVKLAHQGLNQWMIDIVTSCVESRPTSLKFDSNGNPSVAYSDDKNGILKLARIVQ